MMYFLRIAVLFSLAVTAFAVVNEMTNCSVKKSKVDYEVHERQCCAKIVGYTACVKAETNLMSWTQGAKPPNHVDSGTLTVTVDGDPIMKMPFSADSSQIFVNKKDCTNNMYFGKVCLKIKRVTPKDWHKGGVGICYLLSIPRHEYVGAKCIYLNFKEFIDISAKDHLIDA
uniref:Heteropteran venom family 4 protein 1 n=1 Tax=Oncocephalus sp. TaxID=2944721 RepID=A0AB38ZEL3_9HEMI